MITVLAGGVGAARLLRGMVRVVPPAEVTAVVNTGDDTVMHGLYISPDLDTLAYTLAGRADEDRGWGLAGETWNAMDALEALGGESWFRLGDRDLATHMYRTHRLAQGEPLSTVTHELAAALGVPIRLLPMSDDPVRTRLRLAADGREVAFQEYFVRLHHDQAVDSVWFDGAESARPAPGAVEAIDGAEMVVVCPSNPVLSIGPILAVAGLAEAMARRRQNVVAVSPIVAGAALKGPADRIMAELGEEPSVVGVARRYRDIAATLVVDEADASLAPDVERLGMRCVVAPSVMYGVREAALLAQAVVEAGRTEPAP